MPFAPALVTGATGFVGHTLSLRLAGCERLSLSGRAWLSSIREASFRGRVVVHLAGRVDPTAGWEQLSRDNLDKTAELAQAAARGGAERFVFLSTAKVHGEESGSSAFTPESPAAPADDYARSKWLAEEALRDICAREGMPWVVLRAPLVYGRGARGNFRALRQLADSPLWLPLGGLRNRRSLVHVNDLAEALLAAAYRPEARARTFMAAHPVPVSTAQLVLAIRECLGRPPRLFAVRPGLVESIAGLASLRKRATRLTRSLEVDPSSLLRELGWRPALDLRAGLREALA